jgi:hypothetical protein
MANDTPSHRGALIELAATVAAPTVVLLFLSGEGLLGQSLGLVVALAFPLLYLSYTLVVSRRVSGIAVLAVVSVLLTGGIGLLELDVGWFAWKEAAFPALMGLLAVLSIWTPWPVVPAMLDPLFDQQRLGEALAARGTEAQHQAALMRATWQLGLVFQASALSSFVLARWMVVSPTGTEAFNNELGSYTALSFALIGLPSMAGMGWILYRLLIGIEARTGLHAEDLLKRSARSERES